MRGYFSYAELKNFTEDETVIKKYTESRSTAEVFAELYPVQKLQLLVYIPYVSGQSKVISGEELHQRVANPQAAQHYTDSLAHNELESKITHTGFGDPTLLAHYQLFNISAHTLQKQVIVCWQVWE